MKARHSLERGITVLALLTCSGSLVACASVPRAVKGLATMQAETTRQTLKNADLLVSDTEAKVKAFEASLKQLDLGMQAIQAEEAKYALVFSANQNLESKSDVDATAAAYMVTEIYLANQAGLSAGVKEQFAASEAALQTLAKDWKASWQGIQQAQKIIGDYAAGSAVSDIDANFVAAVAREVPGGNERLDTLLNKMTALKQSLDAASAAGLGNVKAVSQARSVTAELVDLFEAVHKSNAAK